MISWVFLVLVSIFASAQEKDFSSWRKFTQASLEAETTGYAPGSTGAAGFHITLVDKWHTYWVNPGDSGSAIHFDFKPSPGVTVKSVGHPLPGRELAAGLISFAYSHEVLFPIELEISPQARIGSVEHLEVDAEWLVCDEVCIPAIETFRLDLPISKLEDIQPGPQFAKFQEARRAMPTKAVVQARYEWKGDKASLRVPDWNSAWEFVDFFPFRGSGLKNDRPSARVEAGELFLTFDKGSSPPKAEERVGVLLIRDPSSNLIHGFEYGESGWQFSRVDGAAGETSKNQLLWMLISAFLGGLILNLMPCVFPILSMKLLSLLKVSAGHESEIRRNNLAYVLGVMVTFLTVALVLSGLRNAGASVGWGFQLQSPVFLAGLIWLFVVLTLNLLGYFELSFAFANAGHRLTRIGGVTGSFFTGVLAVVVASPCTAPFMGVAVGFGLSQSTATLVGIFLSLGFGLAFPYALFVIYPGFQRFLPKPGAWMDTIKKVMSAPMILTILWLAWVLHGVAGAPGVGIVSVGAIVILTVILIGPKFKSRMAMLLFVLVSLGIVLDRVASSSNEVSQVSDENWKPYTEALMSQIEGRSAFVNMTADWCLSCKVNERLVFSDPEVLEAFRRNEVTLVKGDWTRRNPAITKFLSKYNRVGVPFYVIFSPRNPSGRVLPEVLTKSILLDLIAEEFPSQGG
ncbi:MAG: protein-disulfide reductase DsbD family protein [Bdellovibrionales bacterium]